MHKNVFENVIAGIIVTALSTALGFILRAFGFSAGESINIAVFALFALAFLFLIGRKLFPKYKRLLTMRLLDDALKLNSNSTDDAAFKNQILERVERETSRVDPKTNNSIREFPNQVACESDIRQVAHNAKKVKVLTIRGEKYFLGPNSLLYDLYSSKRAPGFTVEVLVLSPASGHITEEHARYLGHRSAEEIRRKMRITLDYLKHIEEQNKNFEVRCYDEPPNFKILIFDDVMFMSTFAGGGPKNDHHAKMLQITQDGDTIFSGFEKYFDDLWKRCNRPSEYAFGEGL